MRYTATYDPTENKLRLYASSRLDAETYARVKAAGFSWAPKQELFVAPMWTPAREDLLLELAGEITDEDTSLVERAEERSERFEDYGEKRAEESQRAHKAVSAIADGIPLGQPILVGHHSERHARRDAEKIEAGMRKAVNLWKTSQYWEARAKGAIRHAKYKELPAVRHRRIKGIEADKRKVERSMEKSKLALEAWQKEGLTRERALFIANYLDQNVYRCYTLAEFPRELPKSQYEGSMSLWSALDSEIITPEQARDFATPAHERGLERAQRWIEHYENRLTYEKAMLGESGGVASERFDIKVGGRVLIRGEWVVVLKINKVGGAVSSLTTTAKYVSVRGIEEVKDYREPEPGDTEKVKAATKLPPLCNYPGEGFLQMTKAEYDATVPKWSDFPKIGHRVKTETVGAHRVRQTRAPGKEHYHKAAVFLTDVKRVDPPTVTTDEAPITFVREIVARPEPEAKPEPLHELPFNQDVQFTKATDEDFRGMAESLRAGVKVVSAPQLFPTPKVLAERMVGLAEIPDGARILEPSAGTGNLITAILADKNPHDMNQVIIGVEVSYSLAEGLRKLFAEESVNVRCSDFLECNGNLGKFDRILMNPPFVNGADIKHIQHATGMLKPGGRLVAICANGPRQNAILKPLIEDAGGDWEELPAGTFEVSGTGVNTVLLTMTKE